MEMGDIQTQRCKFSRVGNGRNDAGKIGQKGNGDRQYPDDEEDGDLKRPNSSGIGGGGGVFGVDGGGTNRLSAWHHSSRIIRVSRASGGKDRHSKVWTSKGLRDRRVRLSVTTAIQFYDLQDRLGYDQPSKAVEWLIKAAADSIAELPSLNGSFPDTPKQLSDEKRNSEGTEQGFDSADVELDDPSFNQNQNQHLSLSKSACSSNSETSKGSGLSLSRSDMKVNRVKARERARERAAKEKEKENDSRIGVGHHQNLNPISQNSTFTELLTAGISSVSNNSNNTTTNNSPSASEANLFHKAAEARQWPLTPMDYFSTGLLGPSSRTTHHHSSGFSGQVQLGTSVPQAMTMSTPPFSVSAPENHQEQLQHFPFVSDHMIPVAATTQPEFHNLNFTISSGLAGYNNRGTLQSNSSSTFLPPHLQRFSSSSSSSSIDGSTNLPFFIGAATPAMDHHHHHHHHQFPPGLQLCYGDGSRHSDQKGKGKN
ncbi:hypothetical protein K2173_006610 [Erythroxylum novogranatense]|uniref:Transcription factor TCP2-like n=1 Tax=Erythroxylum novogranatense TaxID=1862640 RepID=A0AAV8T735_9ROSI|nr:hypothetical protein K2173_006610 [Erythroxylum novogranatense]